MTITRIREVTERQGSASPPKNPHSHSLHRRLSTIRNPICIHKELILYQFREVFRPSWFGTVQWYPFITDYSEAVKEAQHFNTKFFCSLLDVKPKKIPDPPGRPRIIWFHEKAPVCINPQNLSNPRFRLAYHSHFHLEACPEEYDYLVGLYCLISLKVAKKFRSMSTNHSENNKGFMIKPWNWEHHANYNFKDYYTFRHDQDADLVLDIWNSDLSFPRN